MLKRVFKAGNYGDKGNYPISKLEEWVREGKEFALTAGHVGDWVNNGYVKTAIPVAGKVSLVEVDTAGYLIADITKNEFGEKVSNDGMYTNYSLGVKGNNVDHLAILGYAPPHIKDLDKYAEFSTIEGDINYIEFKEGGEEVGIEEILEALKQLKSQDLLSIAIASMEEIDVSEVSIEALCDKLWEKQDEAWFLSKIQAAGYTAAKEFSEEEIKEFAEGIGFDITKKKSGSPETAEEMETRIRSEFAAKDEDEKRIIEKETFKEKFVKIYPPAMQKMAEFTVDEAFSKKNYSEIIEFSEDEKVPMRKHLEKMVVDGGPFKGLFAKIGHDAEFNEGDASSFDKGVNSARATFGIK